MRKPKEIQLTLIGDAGEKEVKKSMPSGVVIDSFGTMKRQPTMNHDTLEKMYLHSETLRHTIDMLARSVVVGGYILTKPHGSKATDRQRDILKRFIDCPNDEETFTDILWDMVMNLLTYGDGFWELAKPSEETVNSFLVSAEKSTVPVYQLDYPMSLYSLHASTIRIETDEHGKAMKFYQGDPQTNSFTPDAMLHFKLPNPSNDVYGLSPSETITTSVAADIFINDYNAKFFANNATPRLHINLEDAGEAEVQRFMAMVNTKLRGKPHMNIVTGGKVKIEPVSLSSKDMEFFSYEGVIRQRIYAAFGMQSNIMGYKDKTSLDGTDVLIYRNFTIRPLQKLIESKIQRRIVERLFGYDIEFHFNPIDTVDLLSLSRVYEVELKNQIRTVNEVRKERGLQSVPWGDTPIIPWSNADNAKMTTKEKPAEEKKDDKN